MKRWTTLLLAIALCPSTGTAQQGVQGLNWRSGDPFVFCRYGLKSKPRAWFPIPDYATSVPLPTPGYCPYPMTVCPYPLTYLKGWTQDEINAYYAYLRICPQAEQSGKWEGQGDGTSSPFSH